MRFLTCVTEILQDERGEVRVALGENLFKSMACIFIKKFTFWHQSHFYEIKVRFCSAAAQDDVSQCIKPRHSTFFMLTKKVHFAQLLSKVSLLVLFY